jgi:RimJ/RimL family protein N-acetyltransferase
MTTVAPFDRSHADQVLALLRTLHPDSTWPDNPEQKNKMFEPGEAFEHIGYIVQRRDAVIASVFGTCARDNSWPRNRLIHIEARPEDIAADWLDQVLTAFVNADRGRSDTWHMASPTPILSPVLAPLLEAAGFVRHSSKMLMEWSGESVTVVDPSPAHLERYAGGNREIDRAIVDLHNRSYRPSRMVPPVDLERLWEPWPGLEVREFVLAVENDRVVGYAEWFVTASKPCIYSFVAARSHWGTSVGSAVGTKAMQIIVELGHHEIQAFVNSNNMASMRLHLKHGWKVASELARTFVRKL